MTTKSTRNIVKIDEEKCNGCGICVPSCAEGALKIIDGKARLVSEVYCDGLGACLGECPQDAITIEVREAEDFDEAAAMEYVEKEKTEPEGEGCTTCATANIARLFEEKKAGTVRDENISGESELGHWPIQLTLVPPNAPFFRDADLLVAADCTAFAYPTLHQDFLRDHAVVVACPKLDDAQAHLAKLTEVFKQSLVKSVTILRMEVPCCSGLVQLTRLAVQASGKDIPVKEIVISAKGEILTPA